MASPPMSRRAEWYVAPSPPMTPPRAVPAKASRTTTVTITAAMTSAATSLATSTGIRRGDSVKVVSAVRWVHSEVMARMPTTGRIRSTGTIAASSTRPNASGPDGRWVSCQPRISTDRPTIAASSNRPLRVSTALRSSIRTSRRKLWLGPKSMTGPTAGERSVAGAWADEMVVGFTVAVLMLPAHFRWSGG